jgi:uncharacterized membrane protein (DUF485 family)
MLPKIRFLLKQINSNWFIVFIVIILIGFDIFIHIPIVDIQSNYFGAMLGFVGVLAAFIVVSNYAHAEKLEEKFERQAKEIEKKFDEKTKMLDEEVIRVIRRLISKKEEAKKASEYLYLPHTDDNLEDPKNHNRAVNKANAVLTELQDYLAVNGIILSEKVNNQFGEVIQIFERAIDEYKKIWLNGDPDAKNERDKKITAMHTDIFDTCLPVSEKKLQALIHSTYRI